MFNYKEYTKETPFADYALHVLEVKEFQGLKHRTLSGYKAILYKVTPYIGNFTIGDISPAMLNELYAEFMRTENICAKTIKNRQVFISTVLQQAVREQIISYNAAAFSTPPKVEKTVGNYYTGAEIIELKKAIRKESPKWQMIFILLLCTGIRRGELVGLKWSDVDKENNSLRICRTVLYTPENGVYIDTPKNTSSYRTISIPKELTDMLLRYHTIVRDETECGVGEFIFCQKDGISPMHPDSVSSYFYRFTKKFDEFKVNAHAFRHTMASILISDGVDYVTVSHRLGHKNVSTTLDIYSHVMTSLDTVCSDCISSRLL